MLPGEDSRKPPTRAGDLGIDPQRVAAWGRVGRRPPRRTARSDPGRPVARGGRGNHRDVERGLRGRRLVRPQRRDRGRERHRRGSDGPYDAGGAAARRASAGRTRAGRAGHSRSRTSRRMPRRSCSCTARTTGSYPASRASGCTKLSRRRGSTRSSRCTREQTTAAPRDGRGLESVSRGSRLLRRPVLAGQGLAGEIRQVFARRSLTAAPGSDRR
jgi:hypothetical protein